MQRLVIIDDSITMRTFLTKFLEKVYEVEAFETADLALEWFKSGNRTDIIICDLNLPGMGGTDFISYYRSLINDQVPIIVLSGAKELETRLECMELGANDFIKKPFLPKELLLRLKKLLVNNVKLKTASVKHGRRPKMRENLGLLQFKLRAPE